MTEAIEVKGCCLTYPMKDGSIHALEDVSFSAREGEFISIVGPSGCGKSTLIKVIAGLLPLTKGEVHVEGILVKGPHPNVGIVFQNAVLLAWRRVLDNIMLQVEVRKGFDKEEYVGKAMELIKMAGLAGFERRFPWELSGGMQQRVSFCRALIHDPPLLLMDEPFGALDAMTRDEMNVWLQKIWTEKTKTVLFVTHDIAEAVFLSDRILIMSPRPGTVKEVLDIDLPRPRDMGMREGVEFNQYVGKARRIMHSG
ncbi:MAG: ABC transporter ATP-binding protein [Deltaproteobacteria bacterium]|nr:ABC transporter ATP-binding protein [Deltaproteobacteria bacterium]MBW2136680.1 ABC transporter ATP-binding protein [Deltaproteobacteria bacterium]